MLALQCHVPKTPLASTNSCSSRLNVIVSATDDVALILVELVERVDAAGLVIDVEGGDIPIVDGLDKFIKKGKTEWLD